MPELPNKTDPCLRSEQTVQNNHVRNCPANSDRPPPNTIPEICRFAPASPNMNISPPITIDTSASDRASGPVNVSAKLVAARSQGDCASATVGTNNRIATAKSVDRARKQLPHIGSSIVSVAFAVEQMVDGPSKTSSKIDGWRST